MSFSTYSCSVSRSSKRGSTRPDQVWHGRISGLLGATTVTTIYYVGERHVGPAAALQYIGRILTQFEVAPVGRAPLQEALHLGFADYEDAVLHEAGRHAGAEAIVTRNTKDFAKASLSVYEPAELVRLLRIKES